MIRAWSVHDDYLIKNVTLQCWAAPPVLRAEWGSVYVRAEWGSVHVQHAVHACFLLLEAWTLFLRSTLNMYRPLLCVCYIKHWFQSVRTCPYSWATGRNNRNKILSPNSLQNAAKLNKNSPNFWKRLHLYQNVSFSLEISRLKLFYLSPCIPPESA